ncbi:hypothetical protein IW261DRAFT_59517 [Armillaria novae-zelandiae]|uniref:Uncharacterized protein n=1 Tax=Armillaria novae-zelandiae TaxID=153914 RepID=A0AA39PVR6_9AGAR|nr:hypothetical protein IW261DRAFT_59517 [Armillaria novae-zelandiae]
MGNNQTAIFSSCLPFDADVGCHDVGLFWVAVLLAWRAFTQGSVTPGRAGTMGATSSRREAGFTGGALPYPCSADDIYCVVEEWSFF